MELFPEEMYPVLLTFCPQCTLSELGNQFTSGSFLFTDSDDCWSDDPFTRHSDVHALG